MHIYKLYVPDTDRLGPIHIRIRDLIHHKFNGCTIYKADGMWLGLYEPVRIYEVITENRADHIFDAFSELLKTEGEEEAVLYTIDTITTKGI